MKGRGQKETRAELKTAAVLDGKPSKIKRKILFQGKLAHHLHCYKGTTAVI